MKGFALIAATLVLSTGCRAPMPNWNIFGPYGATRVPPPPTGGYGTPQPYYAPGTTIVPPTTSPTSAPVGTGFRPAQSNRWSNIVDPVIGPVAKTNTWGPTRPASSNARVVDLRDVDVALASHESAAPTAAATVVVERDGPIRILGPESSPSFYSTSATEPPRLRGMVVNDLTRAAEPRAFNPSGRVIDISQLPDAPVTASSTRTQSSSSDATVIDGGWKSRTTTLRVSGT
ncbi:MAG: hypothetical protein H8E66_20150 [Planctomycetes bacterium]|nr:hypothetical protein [Planctomycetota bacterium]